MSCQQAVFYQCSVLTRCDYLHPTEVSEGSKLERAFGVIILKANAL